MSADPDILRYFYIDEETGVIYVRSSLAGVLRTSFSFRVRVVDNGFPQRSDEANVLVRVDADRSTTRFIRGCDNQTVPEVCTLTDSFEKLVVVRLY